MKSILKTCATVLAVILTLFAIQQYIGYLVDKKVHEENFIDNIASRVRPFVIFDQNGSILAEKGARKFIDKIEVERNKKDGVPISVKVAFTKAFGVVPVLECLDDIFVITYRRGTMYEIIYGLGRVNFLTFHGATISNWRFRLEIVR